MTAPRTCVITVNFNGATNTAACIASLFKSTVPLSIVVVDNTPNDPELGAALLPFPEITLLHAPENLGFGRGNNLGIEWAIENTDSEFIFIFNNDATVEADTVQNLENALETHLEAGIAAARIVLEEDASKLWYGGGEVDWRRGGGRTPGVLGNAEAPLAMQGRYVTFASGCAMLIRRSVLEQVNGFDSRFFMYEEDLELSLRVQEAGWKIWYEPIALVRHRGQGSMRQAGKGFTGLLWSDNPNLSFYVFHIIRNRLINMSIHAKGWNKIYFVFFFPLMLIKLCVRFALGKRWDGIKAISQAVHAFRKTI